jgi:hypothetical protein
VRSVSEKVTTQQVLGELAERGVKFLTLRMRSPSLVKYISRLAGTDFTTITLDRPGPHNKPKVHEDPAVKLTSYPGTVRQLVVTGLGRDAPTVIITNDTAMKTRPDQPVRPPDDHRAAPRRDHPRVLRRRPVLHRQPQRRPRHHARRPRPGPAGRAARGNPDTLQRRFPGTRGEIITSGDTITVRLERRAFSPVLRSADLPPATPIPWWGGRSIRYEFA